MNQQLLTIEDAARYLNVSKTSLRRWTNEGRLRCVRVGPRGERRFHLEDIRRFLEDPAHGPGPAPAPALELDPRRVLDPAAQKGIARHVALHYRDRDELWRLFRSHVLDHLGQHAPMLYIHEVGARAHLLEQLRHEGLHPDKLEASGLLRLLVPAEAYLRTGSFSAPRMLDFVESGILDRRALGHTRMLISGDMTWYLTGAEGVEGMFAYESGLNELLRRYPDVTIVCNYDVHRLSGHVIVGALCSHPHVQLPDRMAVGYYRP
jgi:excisionase family DNA binding protein